MVDLRLGAGFVNSRYLSPGCSGARNVCCDVSASGSDPPPSASIQLIQIARPKCIEQGPSIFPFWRQVARVEAALPICGSMREMSKARLAYLTLHGKPVSRWLEYGRSPQPNECAELVFCCCIPNLVCLPQYERFRAIWMACLHLDKRNVSGGFVSNKYVIISEIFRKQGIGDATLR
jgi:hypothetical protein